MYLKLELPKKVPQKRASQEVPQNRVPKKGSQKRASQERTSIKSFQRRYLKIEHPKKESKIRAS
ncbi:hypothetical protein BpHYR1_003512 [Brachionus plicatilis]|uniref:Uncharacterized protein n=1 Tax=Brachionus plicatilis TaxID=10195 RepID=A0A3M7PGV8_BRAPC|nr:hypothetical protein BpHYR1_003512 [Brachionus plicatilis]